MAPFDFFKSEKKLDELFTSVAGNRMKLEIRQIVFHLNSQYQFLVKLSSLISSVNILTLMIRYPKTELGKIIKAKHPKTMIIKSAIDISDFVVDVNFEKLILLMSIVNNLKAIFEVKRNLKESDEDFRHESLGVELPKINISKVNEEDIIESNQFKKMAKTSAYKGNECSINDQNHFKKLPKINAFKPNESFISDQDQTQRFLKKANSKAFESDANMQNQATNSQTEFIEKNRFLFNFDSKIEIQKFAILYGLPEKENILKFSFENLSMKFLRTILAMSIKNLSFGFFSESKKSDSDKNLNEEIISFPIVS